MQSSEFNVKRLELQSPFKNLAELILVLNEVVENVAEETVEDVQGSINLGFLLSLNEGEENIEKVLPDSVVLFSAHSTLDFDGDIANFVHVSLVRRVDLADSSEKASFDGVASVIRQALPQVNIVLLVLQITGIHGLSGDIAAKNDGSKGLGLDRDRSLCRVEDGGHEKGILGRLGRLGCIKLGFSSLALLVVVAENLLEDAGDTGDVFRSDRLNHLR